ncbi:MAG: DUF2235 domain-containing protein [Pseudorhodoplanes sp.]
MPKNIVVYSDGTGQDGGARPEQTISNIYKMYRVSRVSPQTAIDPAKQVTMYDPGLGTDIGTTALTSPVRFLQKLLSSIDGRGITTNIIDCYTFIINHYEPGDRIFLFGFSRGAYTARSVADLLRLCGVPTKDSDKELLRFRARTREIATEAVIDVLEHGAGHPRADFETEREILSQRFRDKYGSNHETGQKHRANEAPYFVGVFDTVAALGASGLRRFGIQTLLYGLLAAAGFLPAVFAGIVANIIGDLPFWSSTLWVEAALFAVSAIWLSNKQQTSVKKTIHDYPKPGEKRTHIAEWEGTNFNRLLSIFVQYARSANAIDENRKDFDRVPWGPTNEMPKERNGIPTFAQYFFAGNHSDVGGSYPEVESRLSDVALQWMLEQAISIPNGLIVGPIYVNDQKKMEGSGDLGEALFLHPSANGVQHDEICGTADTIGAIKPAFIARLLRNKNYEVQIRKLPKDATVHPTVANRMTLPAVQHADGLKPYRPDALKPVDEFATYYSGVASNAAHSLIMHTTAEALENRNQ